MKITIDELKALPQQRLTFDFNENLEQSAAIKPVVGDLTLSYSVSGLKLVGRVKTLLKLHCDRCLRPYFQALSIDIEERFVPASHLPDERDVNLRELLRDDFVEPVPNDGILDITDVVYQAVTLATPSYCLCGDECPGPPGPKSQEQNAAAVPGSSPGGKKKESTAPIDPRWKNLKTLFPNEDSQ
ncbi:MAG TPA: DUF177 domain-containing protein [Planktothrix sp.]|jgi:uncharacterized metal-binding protein YceD (DUF177 family)